MTQSYPVLPLRDIVVFPDMIVPLFVGRDKSVAALEAAMDGEQGDLPRRPARSRPRTIPAATISTISASIATVLQLLKLPDGTVRVLVEGQAARARSPTLREDDGSSDRRGRA